MKLANTTQEIECHPKYQQLLREHEIIKSELEFEEEMIADLLEENMKLKKTIQQMVFIGNKSGDL